MQKASSDFSLAQRFITAGAAAWGDDDDDYDAFASVSILGGLSAAAQKAHKPSLEARGRAFRFVLAHVEVDVVAPTVAVREHWLLACRSLPLGGAFVGRVSVATAYEIE